MHGCTRRPVKYAYGEQYGCSARLLTLIPGGAWCVALARMQEQAKHTAVMSARADQIAVIAARVEAWSGEPLLQPDEEASEALAEGSARRRALDAALEEIEEGRRAPSPAWKINFALMLGLERVLGMSGRTWKREPSCAATRSMLSPAC